VNRELATYRKAVAEEYTSLYQLYCRFTSIYSARLSDEEEEEAEATHCFTEVASTMQADLFSLEVQLLDSRKLLAGYITQLSHLEREHLDDIACASMPEDGATRDELDRLETSIESFERRKTYWERVRYRLRRRWRSEEPQSIPIDRKEIRSESDELLKIDLLYADGSRCTLKLADGIPRIERPDDDVVYF
jgi:hypothetical protein